MLHRHLLSTLSMLLPGFLMPAAFACDYCGCFMGITPYDNQSSIGVDYRYRSFNGYASMDQNHQVFPDGSFFRNPIAEEGNEVLHNADPGGNLSPEEYEIYRTAELRLKYFVHHRVELNALLPYRWNKHVHPEDGEYHALNGLGDLMFLVGYHVISKPDALVLPQRLILGGGAKFPSGKNDISQDGMRLDHELQPGSGSTDYLAYVNYIAGYRHAGLNLVGLYRVNGSNRFSERNSNSTSAQAHLFYKLKANDWFFIPSLQGYYEYTKGMTVNRELMDGTGSNLLLAGGGVDIYIKRIGLKLACLLPVMERQTGGVEAPAASAFLCAGLVIGFDQRSFLLGKPPD